MDAEIFIPSAAQLLIGPIFGRSLRHTILCFRSLQIPTSVVHFTKSVVAGERTNVIVLFGEGLKCNFAHFQSVLRVSFSHI
jgi:hypothetical protein